MVAFLQRFIKTLPTLATGLILAIAVWAFAVIANDPLRDQTWPTPIAIEIIGQDPSLIISTGQPTNVSVVLRAPTSIWAEIQGTQNQPLRAILDLSGMRAGDYTVPIHLQLLADQMRVVSFSPESIDLTLEALASEDFSINLIQTGEIPVGYQAGPASLDIQSATVRGPQSQVDRVAELRAELDVSSATEELHEELDLFAVDSEGTVVSNVTITPSTVMVTQPINQRSGYRDVAVNLVVVGRPANGYRLVNVSVTPAVVTVFSSDPSLVANLPGYVSTSTLDLTGLRANTDFELPIILPSGITVVGGSSVQVQVGITSLEGSVTLPNVPVEMVNLGEGLEAQIAPQRVDVILSGPLPVLDGLTANSIRVTIDLSDLTAGSYTLEPSVIPIQNVTVVSILPSSLEAILSSVHTVIPTSTPRP